jgi:hypothetical protein
MGYPLNGLSRIQQRCDSTRPSCRDRLTETGMRTSNTFNPKGIAERSELSQCASRPKLTGRFEHRGDTLPNAGDLPKWSCSLVAHAYVLEGGQDVTASPVIFVLLPSRLLVHVWVRYAIISHLICDRPEVGHAAVRRARGRSILS